MKYKTYEQHQLELFKQDIYENIPKDDICLFIDEIVENLDLTKIDQLYVEEGNTAYHPKLMIKLYFLGYNEGVFSSRKLFEKLQYDIRYCYISGKQIPNFRTIANFRKKFAGQLKDLFSQIVMIALESGMAGLKLVAIDGTKIKANANRDGFTNKEKHMKQYEQIEKDIEEAFQKMDDQDKIEDEKYGEDNVGDRLPEDLQDKQNRLNKIREVLEKHENLNRVNPTDPDCGLMKSRDGFIPAYNSQAVVDIDSGIILTADVTNSGNDKGQIKENIGNLEKEIGKKPELVLADSGYFDGANLQYMNDNDIKGLVADTSIQNIKKERDGEIPEGKEFDKDRFIYDWPEDCYICPEGRKLYPINKQEVEDIDTDNSNVRIVVVVKKLSCAKDRKRVADELPVIVMKYYGMK